MIIQIIHRKAKSLKKERNDGYIEYKWKLDNVENRRKIKLTTQMNYRINEGNGKSMYAIGFSDNGFSKGITYNEMKKSLYCIEEVSNKIDVNINKILLFINNDTYWAKIFLYKQNLNKNFL